MQSSSRLFPVSLMRAEFAGSLNEDVYQLNPRISADPSLRITVTRVTDPAWRSRRQPLILLHSEFQNRRQWLSPGGGGFAATMAREGYDVWLPEVRGHGLSPTHDRWHGNTLSQIALEDWPALQEFVREQSGSVPLWVGVGLGGLSLSYSLIHAPPMAQGCLGVVLVDVATAHWHRRLRHTSLKDRWRARRRGYLDGQELAAGVEREPWALFTELRSWLGRRKRKQHPVWSQLGAITQPTLVVAVQDREAEARKLHEQLGSERKDLLVGQPDPERSRSGVFCDPETADAVRNWLSRTSAAQSDPTKLI